MVSTLDSVSKGLGSLPGRVICVVLFGKTVTVTLRVLLYTQEKNAYQQTVSET